MDDADRWLDLLNASRKGDVVRVRQLLDDGANVNAQDVFDGYTPLHYAISSGSVELVRLLLERGAQLEHNKNTVRQTPLCTAVISGKVDMVKCLLQAGADARAKTFPDGRTLVDIAVEDGNETIAELLARHA